MPDEQTLQQGGGSILQAFAENFILSILTLGVYAVLAARNSGVAVTDERIIVKDGGIFGANTREVRLDNVQGVKTKSLKIFFVIPAGTSLSVSNAAGEVLGINTGNPGDVRNAINRAQSS